MTRAALAAGFAAASGSLALAELALAQRERAGAGARRRRGPDAIAALASLGRRLGPLAPPGDLRARLAAAGAPFELEPADAMELKLAAAALALLAAAALAGPLPGRLGLVVLAGAAPGGFLVPDAWLARRARRRAAAMSRELPDVLDLLRVAISAGLGVERALAEVARRRTGPLAGELSLMALELELGAPRARALAGLRERCPVEGVAALVAALERAQRHGAPLAATLAAQAADARARRARRIRADAATAAPKIQLVIALALVPSVLLLVAAELVGALA